MKARRIITISTLFFLAGSALMAQDTVTMGLKDCMRYAVEPTPYFEQLKNNGGEYVQLSLSIPIFDRLSKHSNIAKRKNAYDRAQADYELTMQTVEAEVRRAIADRDGSADALRQADTRAELQQEAFTLNTKRFEQGLISSIEYQTASNNYLNALAEQLNAKLQYYIKCSVVTYYGGTPYLEQ